MLPKTHTAPSVTSLDNISLKKKPPNKNTNPGINLPCLARLPNTNDQKEMEENAPQLYKKRKLSKNQSQNQAPSKKEISLYLNSEDTTTEATSQSESTIKTPTLSSYGKSPYKI